MRRSSLGSLSRAAAGFDGDLLGGGWEGALVAD